MSWIQAFEQPPPRDSFVGRWKTFVESSQGLWRDCDDNTFNGPIRIADDGRLTSRWIGPGMLGEFGVIVICSGRAGGRAERGPGRSARGR
jgi:hypothetical protein